MNLKRYWLGYRGIIMSILTIALPTIADMFVQTLLGFFDMVMVGRLGPVAISSVGIGNAPIMTIMTVFFAIGTGTTAIVSRAYGSKNQEEGKAAMSQSLYLGIPISAIVTILFLVFGKEILTVIGTAQDMRTSIGYYTAVSIGLPMLCFNIIFAYGYRAISQARIPMMANVISVTSNIVLNYIFIFVLDMGILGAGIATTLARGIVTCIYIYLTFFTDKYWISIKFKTLKYEKIMADRILKIGLPSALEQSLFRVGMLIFETMVIKLGTLEYAAHKIALTAESVSFNIGFGFAVAGTALVGQKIGNKEFRMAKKMADVNTFLAVAVMSVFGLLFFIIPHLIISMFTKDPQIFPLATGALRIVSIAQPFLAVSMVLSGVLRGAGDTKAVLWITSAGMYLIRTPLTYIFLYVFNFGLIGAWVVMTIDLVFRSYCSYVRFKNGKWRYIQV
ncbi:MAG: MATE family efflux transporter [Cetobacterium sp.]|uniref:MATE family efflux transporter n=1 Tax=Cetobacterium sp. TaxID=2071632 RepID=UPI002FCA75F3